MEVVFAKLVALIPRIDRHGFAYTALHSSLLRSAVVPKLIVSTHPDVLMALLLIVLVSCLLQCLLGRGTVIFEHCSIA